MEYLTRCRICLTTISSVKIKINVAIQREFHYLTSEELEGSEKYSNEICADCFVCLQNSCKFKAFCQENQKKLREKLMEIKRPQTQPNKKMDDPLPVDLDFIKTEPTLEITPVFVETHPEIKTEEADSDQERENLINYYLNMATSQKAEKPVKEKKPKTKTVQNKITKKPTTQSTRQDPSEIITCDYCPKSMIRGSMSRHMKTAHRKDLAKQHVCEICGKAFIYQSILKQHMYGHNQDSPFECDFCGKNYKSKSMIRSHIIICHSTINHVICSICGKTTHKHEAKHHMYTHKFNEDPNNFDGPTCDYCGKIFAHKFLLLPHIKNVHMDLKRETCNICGRSVKGLKKHMSKHYDRKFKCTYELEDGTICPKGYPVKSLLDRHFKLIHQNIMPHSCSRCKKAYKSKSSLKEHILADHLNLQLDCLIAGCRTKFRTVRALCGHIKVVHRELSKEEKIDYVKKAKKTQLPNFKY